MNNKQLKEKWNKMLEFTSVQGPTPMQQATQNAQQPAPIDQRKLQQTENIRQQIRDLDSKIMPLQDKKRKLEDQLAKLLKN